jgi:leader peptidase (prepilin peptidase)/N-methyltransferase
MLDYLFFAAPGNALCAAVACVFGLLIGSFLNVVIYRLPRIMQRGSDDYIASESEQQNRDVSIKLGSSITQIKYESSTPLPHADRYDLVMPRSACPHCKHQITALENIPVISYLFLRGKCIACKAPISPRYPIIEVLSGALSGYLVWHFGSGWAGLATLLFAYLLIAMTFIDADTQLLPDDLTYPLLWCGLLVNLHGTFVPLHDAVIGAIAGYLVLWSVYWLFKLATGKEGMGYGDFKLLAGLGAWLGWQMLPIVVLLSSVVGALVGIVMIASRKLGRGNPMPFGPYLAAAGLITLLYGKSISQAYLGFLL